MESTFIQSVGCCEVFATWRLRMIGFENCLGVGAIYCHNNLCLNGYGIVWGGDRLQELNDLNQMVGVTL